MYFPRLFAMDSPGYLRDNAAFKDDLMRPGWSILTFHKIW